MIKVLAMPNKSVSIALNICSLKKRKKKPGAYLKPEDRALEVHNALIRRKTLDKSDYDQPKWRRAMSTIVVLVVIVSTYVRLSGKAMT